MPLRKKFGSGFDVFLNGALGIRASAKKVLALADHHRIDTFWNALDTG
jgi:hypothetical protein